MQTPAELGLLIPSAHSRIPLSTHFAPQSWTPALMDHRPPRRLELATPDSSKSPPEPDYMQRIMHSLTDSTSQAAPSSSQSAHMDPLSYSDSYGRIPDISPGLNPWSYFPPAPELRFLVPSTAPSSHSDPVADLSWFSEASSPPLQEDSSTSICPLEGGVEGLTPTDQVAWAHSMLEFESAVDAQCDHDQQPAERSPVNSESLSSSLMSDCETELNNRKRSTVQSCGGTGESVPAEGIVKSGKRERSPEQEDGEEEGDDAEEEGEDARSDDQGSKKPMGSVMCRNRPRKKGGVKRVREPRYAIKTRTDTEVNMEDGYKWRKYGQKAVKNSPHPRNYYRCTTPNCPVRKRVERCIEDPGLVATTYEGTHTHQSPSSLRGPLGYPGSLETFLATLTHFSLASNPLHQQQQQTFPLADLFRASPQTWLPHHPSHTNSALQDNLTLLRAHEFLRLQQEAAWASIKSEPFQFGSATSSYNRPSFSNVSSLSQQSQMYEADQLGSLPLEYSSLICGAGPFSVHQQHQQGFGSNSRAELHQFSGVPASQESSGATSDGGLLEDMFRVTNPTISRA